VSDLFWAHLGELVVATVTAAAAAVAARFRRKTERAKKLRGIAGAAITTFPGITPAALALRVSASLLKQGEPGVSDEELQGLQEVISRAQGADDNG
jgi:hypothetical protein